MRKRITTLAVAAVAALSLTAAFGSASASATGTVLCSSPGQFTCWNESAVMPAGTTLANYAIKGPSTPQAVLELKSFSAPVFCKYAWMKATTTAKSGNPLPAYSSSNYINPASCTMGSSTATCSSVTMNSPPVTMEATGEWGDAVINVGTTAQPLVLAYQCVGSTGTPYNCTFQAKTSPVAVTVKEEELTEINTVPFTRTAGESICGSNAWLRMVGNLWEGPGISRF